MSLALTAEPAVIDGVRSYAERRGMTLEAFVLAYLEKVAKRERKRRKVFYNAELANLAGTWVDDPECEKALSEMRTIDEEMSFAGLLLGDHGQYVKRRHFS